jgi:hypothetical protein
MRAVDDIRSSRSKAEAAPSRYKVVEEQGSPRGDLFELEQRTYYHVVDTSTDEVILTFDSLMEASLSRDTGMWDDHVFTGASEVVIAADERSVSVTYHDGFQETFPLPP